MSQIFKKNIPKNVLFDFLEKINCQKTDKYYIIDITTYKRIIYNNDLEEFFNLIKEYYYMSKFHYIDIKHVSHNKFNTVIRQLCKCNNVEYSKYIKYDKSSYSVVHNVYYADNNDNNGHNDDGDNSNSNVTD
jgi:hypothetical protein